MKRVFVVVAVALSTAAGLAVAIHAPASASRPDVKLACVTCAHDFGDHPVQPTPTEY